MEKIKSFVTSVLVFLLPLFFLPTTQEFFSTNKFYLLGFGVGVILVLGAIELLQSKKIVWHKSPFDGLVLIFLVFAAVSVVISSPNKIQALVTPVVGFGTLLFLGLLYFILKDEAHKKSEGLFNHSNLLNLSATILGVLAIFFFFNPFGKTNLPQSLSFLKNPAFTPVGTQVDLLVFLGFFVLYGALQLYHTRKGHAHSKTLSSSTIFFVIILVGFLLTAYAVFKPVQIQNAQGQNQQTSVFQTLPPFSVTWYSTIETLKTPKTALFGAGLDNFAAAYTRSKPVQYNAGNLWNVNFTSGRSFLLQLWAETGILGVGAFVLLIVALLRAVGNSPAKYSAYYLVAALVLFPPSLLTLLLFFIVLASAVEVAAHGEEGHREKVTYDLSSPLPFATGLAILVFLLVGGAGYFLGRSYVSEYYFKKSIDGFVENNAKTAYDNMRLAITTNPYIERMRINFAQLNMLIANNIAARSAPQGEDQKPVELSAADRQTIAQAIQAAIAEAKAAVALNPNKASNWENLAAIYRNILNVAQGADAWTVASYRQAILLDPQNPIYRLNLGGVFYSLNNYEDAAQMFQQAAALKPDWANAHYNLAWASYQRKDYAVAVAEMEAVLSLITDKKSQDYKRAQKELEAFKKNVPADATSASPSADADQLNLPTPPTASIEPKLQLPQNASPEANPQPNRINP